MCVCITDNEKINFSINQILFYIVEYKNGPYYYSSFFKAKILFLYGRNDCFPGV